MVDDVTVFEVSPLIGPCFQSLRYRLALMAAFAVIVTTLPALAGDSCAYDFPLDSNPTPINSEDVCNFHQVDAQLYRGGRPRPSAYLKLAAAGIRTIINLEEEDSAEKEKVEIDNLNLWLPPDKQVRFFSLPIDSTEIEEIGISDDKLRSLFKQIRDAEKPIFIHCYHGKDRTGAVVAIYRMLMKQKSFSEAYKEAYHYGFVREVYGLSKTVDRYGSEKWLRTLPRPGTAK